MLIPLIRTLQVHFPKTSITWVISSFAFPLVEAITGVEFIVVDKPKRLRDYWAFHKRMQGRHFDVLLATQASLRANLLYPLIPATRKIGYDKRRANDGHRWFIHESIEPGNDHTLESFVKFAEKLGCKRHIAWDLPISPEDKNWAASQLVSCPRPLLLLNPAASKAERSWLTERYIEVIKQAQLRWQAHVILIGGPAMAEQHVAEAIAAEVPVINWVGKTKPNQLLALIEQADLVLCPDTGPSHMAAAVGTPVVALHAVTNPDVSGPYPYRQLAVNCYPKALRTVLNKHLETTSWGTQVHGYGAMQLITVAAVMAKLEASLFWCKQE